jgi:hypothetical protein
MRLGMLALMMPVTTSARGVGGDDQMNAGGASHLLSAQPLIDISWSGLH